jgi:hypothetical protein
MDAFSRVLQELKNTPGASRINRYLGKLFIRKHQAKVKPSVVSIHANNGRWSNIASKTHTIQIPNKLLAGL